MQDLRDQEVVRFEKNVLINDTEINPKVFAAWAQPFNQIKLQQKSNEDSKAGGERGEEEQKTGGEYEKNEVMIKEELKHMEGQRYLIIVNEEKIYIFQQVEGQALKIYTQHNLDEIELITVAQDDQPA